MRRIAIAAVLLAACHAAATAPAGNPHVAVAVTPTAVRAGQAITVTLIVRNPGSERVVVQTRPCEPAFVVLDARGTVVGPGGPLCTGSVTSRTLGPGAVDTVRGGWTTDVAPGPYTVQGRVQTSGGTAPSEAVTLHVTP